MVTIAKIDTPGGGLVELQTAACGYLCLLQDGSLILLKPEILLKLADTLRDFLDDEAGKGEDIEGT